MVVHDKGHHFGRLNMLRSAVKLEASVHDSLSQPFDTIVYNEARVPPKMMCDPRCSE